MPILDLRSEEPVSAPTDHDPLDETPPGLDAIRAWIRKPRPWLRGVRLWVRWILSGFAETYRFLKQHAGPAAKKLRRIATEGERAGRAATLAGNAVRKIGGAVTRGARALRTSDGRIGSAGRKLGKLGGAVRRFGGQLNEGGNAAAEIFAGVGRLTRALRRNAQTGLGLLDPPEEPEPKAPGPAPQTLRQSPARRLPRPAKEEQTPRPPAPEAAPEALDEPPAPSPSPGPPPTAAPVWEERLVGLPRVFIPQIKALGERPRSDVLWPLIFEICGWREWTTPAELARWFSMHHRSLVKRHLGPMTKEGLLERRFPDRPNSPRQAYRARRDGAPTADSEKSRTPGSGP